MRSPAASVLPAGALPSPISAMRPPAKAIQPRSMTKSARTILAFPITVSAPHESSQVSSVMPRQRMMSRRQRDRRSEGLHRHARWRPSRRPPAFFPQPDGRTSRLAASSDAVGSSSNRIGRSQMKPRAILDALQFATRKGRRRQRPQPRGNMESPQQFSGEFASLGPCHPTCDQRFRNDIEGRNAAQRRN